MRTVPSKLQGASATGVERLKSANCFTISIARRSNVSDASGVRNAACADSVTFSSFARG